MCTTLSYRQDIRGPRSRSRYNLSCQIGSLCGIVLSSVKILAKDNDLKESNGWVISISTKCLFNSRGGLITHQLTPLVLYGLYVRDHRRSVCHGRGGAHL